MNDIFPNIPRIYTAISEWLACIALIMAIVPEKRQNFFYLKAIALLIGQICLQLWVGTWPLFFWIPGMIINVCWMLLAFMVLVNQRALSNLYNVSKAFIFAEFIASLTWQLYCYLFYNRFEEIIPLQIAFMLISYLLLAWIYFTIEKKSNHQLLLKNIQPKDTLEVILTAVIIFTMSNIGFILSSTNFAIGDSVAIFIFRSLINLCGIFMIYIQENSRYENNLRQELTAINNVFQSQYEQYEAYRESNQIINRKFHDLKHQLSIIEMEPDENKRLSYVNQLKEDIEKYQTNIKTGNPIIDVIVTRKNIYCIENQITFTCIVDGALLSFMNTMDLVSLLGNTLDNAIESTLALASTEKRLINLRVSKKANFVMYSLENYSETPLHFEDGLPQTTKEDQRYHGYGLKSSAYIAEKYNGSLTVKLEDNWFKLNVLIPLQKKGI